MEKLWTDMFVVNVPVIEKVLRSVIVYVFLIVGLRLAGKRQLAQLNPFDLTVLLTLSNTVQNAIIGDDNSVSGGLLGAATLLGINYVVIRFLYSHERVDRLVEGRATVLIDQGQVRQERLTGELVTPAELEAAAHRQGFGSLDEVERATLEPGGTLSFVAKQPPPEITRHRHLLSKLDAVMAELAILKAGGKSSA